MTRRSRRLAAGHLLLVLLLFVCHRAGAVVLAEGQGWERPVGLSDSAEILLDPSNRLGIDDVLAPPFQARFTRGLQPSLPMYTNGTVWIRFSLAREAGTADDWVVQLHPSWLDDIEVYANPGPGARPITVLGDRHPFNERALKTDQLAFPVSVGTTSRTYYLRIRNHGPIPLVLSAWHQEGLAQKEAGEGVFHLLLAGGVGMTVLMSLIFWVRMRDAIYLLFALFVSASGLVIFASHGYGSSVLFPKSALWGDRFIDMLACLFISSATLFVSRLFDYRRHSVALARTADGIAIFYAVLIPLAATNLLNPIWWWLVTLAECLAILGVFPLIRIVARKGDPGNLLFAAIFFWVNASWVIHSAIQQGLVPVNHAVLEMPWIHYLQEGNMLLLSMAVARRLIGIELHRRAQRQRAFESMQLASRALEDRARQREFVAVISHEFRTPLAIISAVSHALEVSPSGRDDGVKGRVKKIRQAVARLTGLIENLLVDDALESSQRSLEDERFDLRDVVASLQGHCLPEDRDRLQLSLPDAALPLRGSRSRIETLLSNMVENALEYSGSTVEVNGRTEGGLLILDVVNFGDPIPKQEQALLFARYFRGARSAVIPGAGLGLHISRIIARQHGGDVDLVSSDAGGTVFRIRLPLGVDAGAAPA